MSRNKLQPISPHDQATLDMLKAAGIELDPATGKAKALEGGPFQGSEPSADPRGPVIIPGPETVTVLPNTEPLTYDESEEEATEGEEVPPAPEAAEPEPEKPEPETPALKGEAKREHDARAAQREMSKTQLKLEKTLNEVNKRFGDLDDQIQKLAALQNSVGHVPVDLNPADEAVVSQYREDYPEAVSVMEAIVAPVYNMLSQVKDQVNGVIQRQGEFFSRMKEDEVFGSIYSKIPKEQVQAITDSPEFISWLSDKPKSKRDLYVDVLNNTSKYAAEDALDIFQEYAKDTGADIGVNGSRPKTKRETPPMDAYPALRSGSALPEARRPQRTVDDIANTPLSQEEMANFKDLLEAAPTNEQKDIILKRLRLTQLSGSVPVKTFL